MVQSTLAKGGNIAVTGDADAHDDRFQIVVRWSCEDDVDVDVSALLLGSDARVRGDDDLVFYNAPEGGNGAVRLVGARTDENQSENRVTVDLSSLPADVERVLVAASLDPEQGRKIGDLDNFELTVLNTSDEALVRYTVADTSSETAIALGELYRRDRLWKFKVISQGWESGLAGLAMDYGITVDSSDDDSQTEVPELVDPEPSADPTSTAAPSEDVPTERAPSISPRTPKSGVRTSKKRFTAAKPFEMKLAAADTWQPARIFSISGVGTAAEQEKRATSALLSTMMAVRTFGRGITNRLGAPAGPVETFIEVPFTSGERAVIPDGVIRVARAGRIWTALLETKTGTNALRADQIGNYLDLAKEQGFDAVVTLSNDLAPVGGPHPVPVDARKTRKVSLHHLSWSEVLHEAQMQVTHHGVDDRHQAWLLLEFIRYLEHPRSGAVGFDDMGAAWVTVREAVAAGTLRSSDKKVSAVAASWDKMIRHLSLRLTSQLGAEVTEVHPRKTTGDHSARLQASIDRLANEGTLAAALRIPNAVGHLDIVADLRTSKVRVSVDVPAPKEGNSLRRVNWMLRQLKESPDDITVEVLFHRREQTSCELLKDVRENSAALLPNPSSEVRSFRLAATSGMGTKRNGLRKAFIPSVNDAVDHFYENVLQGIRGWSASPPKMPADANDATALPVAEVEYLGRPLL